MVTSLYIASAEPQTGKTARSVGLLDVFARRLGRIGVFRPVIPSLDEPDDVLLMLLHHPSVTMSYDAATGVSYDDLHADPARALSDIVDQYHDIAAHHDAVLIVGSDFTGIAQPAELALNARIAANIGAPMGLIVRGGGRTSRQIQDIIDISTREVNEAHARVFACFISRIEPGRIAEVRGQVGQTANRAGASEPAVYVLPEDPLLSAPTVSQLRDVLGGVLIHGDPIRLDQESFGFLIAGMTLPRVLERLYDGVTVVTAGDRVEIVLGVLDAHNARNFPNLSALVLNGDIPLDPIVGRLVRGMRPDLPIIATPENTYTTAMQLSSAQGRLRPDATRKVERAHAIFRECVDGDDLLAHLDVSVPDVVTPMMFEHFLTERARRSRTRIVLPEGTEPRILRAAQILRDRNVVELVLLGDPEEIRTVAHTVGVELDGVELVDLRDEDLVAEFAKDYARRRAHRGMTVVAARDRVVDSAYFGTLYVLSGRAHGMVSGAIHTTAHTIRPAIELLRDPDTVATVSSAFFMCLPDRVNVFADCAIVPSPTADQLADIAISSARTAAAFGIEPRIAMLSYSTGSSGGGDGVDKVREATAIVRRRNPDLVIEGPLQYDAAVDPEVAATKLPDSPVAGQATVFVFPDLNTGNNTYKAVQRSAKAVAVGPIMQGLRAPVNDLSRGATVNDIVNTVAMTAVQAGSI